MWPSDCCLAMRSRSTGLMDVHLVKKWVYVQVTCILNFFSKQKMIITFNLYKIARVTRRVDEAVSVNAWRRQMRRVGRPRKTRYLAGVMLPQISCYFDVARLIRPVQLVAFDVFGIVGHGQIFVVVRVANRRDKVTLGQCGHFDKCIQGRVYFVNVNFIVLATDGN